MRRHAQRTRHASALAVCFLLAAAGLAARQPRPSSGTWITAWGSSQQAIGTTAVTNATVRMIARVTIPGTAIRVRLDNSYGAAPLAVGSAYVGQRTQGAALASGSNRSLTFNGSPRVTIAPGGTALSDPVAMTVRAQQDLAVSLFIPGRDVKPSQHSGAVVTSYLSANEAGDVAADEARTPFTATTTSMFWLKAIDVQSTAAAGAIVAFGDSITDGTCSTLDAHNRWEDWLAVRLDLDARARGGAGAKAVVNEGIGGNTVTRANLQPPPDSMPGVERLERDVLSHAGVTDVVVFMGTNDIRRGASAAQVIAGTEDIVKRLKARGLTTLGVTIIPRHNVAPTAGNSGWDGGKTDIRKAVNQWVRTRAPFDAVLDFDQVVRDAANPDLIAAAFNCDGIHPAPRGYYEMGSSVRLDLFKGAASRASRR